MPKLIILAYRFILNLRIIRFTFLPLKKVDLIIYGHSHLNFIIIKLFKSKKFKIIDREKINLNIFVLLKFLFSNKTNYTYKNYLIFEINHISPKVTISTFDNEVYFWEIADKLKCKTVIIQNGWRNRQNDIFENLKKPKKNFT